MERRAREEDRVLDMRRKDLLTSHACLALLPESILVLVLPSLVQRHLRPLVPVTVAKLILHVSRSTSLTSMLPRCALLCSLNS